MASKATEVHEFSENNLQYVERLLYDVLSYTLPICGLPETNLPTTDCEENGYKLPNFLESAGATVLTRSLTIRNEWIKPMLVAMLSQENSCGIDYEFIALFLNETFLNFQKKGMPVTKNFVVEMSLGFCNEIVLFVHHERIYIDFSKLIKSVSKFIVRTIAPNQNVLEITDELFIEFDNISLYTKFITNFISKYAIPYGFRDDLPELFKIHFEKLWQGEFERPDTPLVIKLKNSEEFSPHQLLTDIAAEESVPLPESLVLESFLTDDRESPKLNGSSENDALRDMKSREKLLTRLGNISDQSAESGQSSKDSSESGIEDDFGQMSLGAKVASQESHGAIPKRKAFEQKTDMEEFLGFFLHL